MHQKLSPTVADRSPSSRAGRIHSPAAFISDAASSTFRMSKPDHHESQHADDSSKSCSLASAGPPRDATATPDLKLLNNNNTTTTTNNAANRTRSTTQRQNNCVAGVIAPNQNCTTQHHQRQHIQQLADEDKPTVAKDGATCTGTPLPSETQTQQSSSEKTTAMGNLLDDRLSTRSTSPETICCTVRKTYDVNGRGFVDGSRHVEDHQHVDRQSDDGPSHPAQNSGSGDTQSVASSSSNVSVQPDELLTKSTTTQTAPTSSELIDTQCAVVGDCTLAYATEPSPASEVISCCFLDGVQERNLCRLLDKQILVTSHHNYPTLSFSLLQFINVLVTELDADDLAFSHIKLNGGAASYVLAADGGSSEDEDASSMTSRYSTSSSETNTNTGPHHYSELRALKDDRCRISASSLLVVAGRTNSGHYHDQQQQQHQQQPYGYNRSRLSAYPNQASNGGIVDCFLDDADEYFSFNDIDVIIDIDLKERWDRVRSAVFASVFKFLPHDVQQPLATKYQPNQTNMWDAYVDKLVFVNNENDRWGLISLLNRTIDGRNLELKFVDKMRRQYQFSVDSFHIYLDNFILNRKQEVSDDAENDSGFCRSVGLTTGRINGELDSSRCCGDVGGFIAEVSSAIDLLNGQLVTVESVYGDFSEAFTHLQQRLIVTRQPEEIRGGGLLRYCHLLVKGFRPLNYMKMKSLEKYMSTRFFIDFNDTGRQQQRLLDYINSHLKKGTVISKRMRSYYPGISLVPDDTLRHLFVCEWLRCVRAVVGSTANQCLMSQERSRTLYVIDQLIHAFYSLPVRSFGACWCCPDCSRQQQQQAAARVAGGPFVGGGGGNGGGWWGSFPANNTRRPYRYQRPGWQPRRRLPHHFSAYAAVAPQYGP